jgi:hypothetical protein
MALISDVLIYPVTDFRLAHTAAESIKKNKSLEGKKEGQR